MHADKILTSGTQMFIVTMGGTGATLVVPFMFMWLCKSKRNRAIGRASVVPTFFGVNEPILFGAPLVLNQSSLSHSSLHQLQTYGSLSSLLKHLGMNSFTANLPWTTTGPLRYCSWYKLPVLIIRSCSIVNCSRYCYLLSISSRFMMNKFEEERSGKPNDELKEKVLQTLTLQKQMLFLKSWSRFSKKYNY